VNVQRVGGGYGMKLSRPNQFAVACSLISKKLNLPCRIIPTLTTNLKAVGKRTPVSGNYEVSL
jgi:xanthine dehydrogenase/oxidase